MASTSLTIVFVNILIGKSIAVYPYLQNYKIIAAQHFHFNLSLQKKCDNSGKVTFMHNQKESK